MKINTKLSVAGCWKMVNAIQNGETDDEIRSRCLIAEQWLKHNEVITNAQYNDLMIAVSYIYRELAHM